MAELSRNTTHNDSVSVITASVSASVVTVSVIAVYRYYRYGYRSGPESLV